VKATLRTHRWAQVPCHALGGKTFATFVGPKEAFAYLQDFGRGETSVTLTGIYESQGHDALSATMISIPNTVDTIASLT
jgi:hypothetical protein